MSINSKTSASKSTCFIVAVDKRPDFIELQMKSLQKFCVGEFELVVLNNSQNAKRTKMIQHECSRLKALHLRVNFCDREVRRSHSDTVFRFGRYISPNVACSYPYHWFTKRHLSTMLEKNIVFIDSDMFLVRQVDFSKLLATNSLYYVPQFRGLVDKVGHEVLYPWNALMIIDATDDKLQLNEIQWSPKVQKGYATDVGGASTEWLESATRNNRSSELLSFGVLNFDKRLSSTSYRVSLNGNWIAELELLEGSDEWSMTTNDSLDLAARILNCDIQDIEAVVVGRLKDAIELINPTGWPDPLWIDLLSAPEIGLDNFILHYKSGSNYQEWATPQYNLVKSEAMKRTFPLLA
jgi:hypothetical protein